MLKKKRNLGNEVYLDVMIHCLRQVSMAEKYPK